ncbi:MAG: DNA helicase RecQ [Salinibacter sp.]|uniref:DNA helicase RecQ n=1 Tax=Salinibacter sp. TaxID=2065818 RepID=UPI0035D3DBA8
MDVTGANPTHVLQSVFGFEAFRPYQESVVQRVVQGRDAFLVMPTGGGKSVCYQLPALVRPGCGIVVSPLISLMRDQVDALRQRGVQAAMLNSSLGRDQRRTVREKMARGELDLCYVAPERATRSSFVDLLERANPALLAIDEAHCISRWGHDFRPEYLELAEWRQAFASVPCVAVTATADPPTQRAVLDRLGMADEARVIAGFDRPNIRYVVTPKADAPRPQLGRFIDREHPGESGIVYCLTRADVEKTATWLNDHGHRALPYHAGLDDATRDEHQARFQREDGLVVVATVAFGMGIDKPDVRFVAHLDVPKTLEAYHQETGRAGRDGRPATAWMAYRAADVARMRRLIDDSAENEDHRWTQRHKLNALRGYCETVDCRRKVLLNYFGETMDGDACGNCDNCLQPPDTWDGTVAAQKALSCIVRTDQRFGSSHITDVLRGRKTDKVQRHGHDALSTFGVGADRSQTEWRTIIRQLVAKGMVRVDVTGYGSLTLTEACRPVLRGRETVEFRDEGRAETGPRSSDSAKTTDRDALPEQGPDRALFEALRERRTQLARDQEVPPYVVFTDKTLRAMVEHRPQTRSAFRELHGVGDVKLNRYGEIFLSEIRSHT